MTREKFIDIVFDGPPGHEAGRFVEVEDVHGRSIRIGEWIERRSTKPTLWALRIPDPRGVFDRRFPIMDGPSVPWSMVAPFEAQAKQNHDQSLEVLASRGGLDPRDLWCIVNSKRLRESPPLAFADAWLRGWLQQHEGPAAELAAARAEIERLQTRQQELLATIVRVTNETPFTDEAKDALAQRGVLVAEIGTLRAQVETLTNERDEARMLARDAQLQAMDRGASYQVAVAAQEATEMELRIVRASCEAASAEVERLLALINTPRTDDFFESVRIESAHQIERWGVEHDAGKRTEDWLVLYTYLLGKAATAHFAGDRERLLHHIITVAAVALNWHRNMTGETTLMRPGVGPIATEVVGG